ncbi:nuclease [Tunturiibacter lichenicola]|uniref:nuclease n=1 Tax=Tunturiibacter lichenicola TaxID=2051959 RepID=UPI0021B1D725|nr:nuclease [Edaphobacter lichenicola]
MVRRLILVFAMGCGVGRAQQAIGADGIGTVGVQDAKIAGALEVSNGRAVLVGNTTVTAKDHTAEVTLTRGGSVKVCATSGLHVTSGQSAAGVTPALMLALDRGAIEVKMTATTRDVVMTPDLRFSLKGDGPLDLQLRVTRNGDTCVENRGAQAPVLNVADPFGDGTYELRAGQHVLFEHGSLKEVVDHESSPCGCPPEPTMTVADALLSGGAAGSGDAAKTAAEAHPFPAAVSAGLAPVAVPPQAPEGALHEQVSATLSSSGGADSLAEPAPAPKADATTAAATANVAQGAAAAAPAAAAQKRGFGHAIGRFFKRIFGGG